MQALQMICLQHYFCKRSNLYPTNCTEFPSRALAENPFHYLPTSLGVDEPLTSSLEVQCSDPHLCYQKTFSLISMKMVTQFSKPFSTMTPEFSLKNKQANQKTSCVWLSKQPCSCGAGRCAGFQSGEETSGGLLRSLTSCYKTYSVTLFLVGTLQWMETLLLEVASTFHLRMHVTNQRIVLEEWVQQTENISMYFISIPSAANKMTSDIMTQGISK